MADTAVFIHSGPGQNGDILVRMKLENGKKISIGSGKKDSVIIPDLEEGHLVIEKTPKGIKVVSKPWMYSERYAPEGQMIVLNKYSGSVLYLFDDEGESSPPVKVPYDCVIKAGRVESKNDIAIPVKFVSGEHFILRSENGNIRIEDSGSTNGTYVNGRKIKASKLISGDVISIMGTEIKLINGELRFYNAGRVTVKNIKDSSINVTSHMKGQTDRLAYRRSPREQDMLPYEDIILAAAPTKGQKYTKGRGMFSSLLGTGAMLGASMLTSNVSPALIAARSASLVSPVSSMASSKSSDKKRKSELEKYEAERREKYGAYIEDQKATIQKVADLQQAIITRENPDLKEVQSMLFELKRNLWERMPSDRDFMDVRIGMGYEDLCVAVKSRNESKGFQMEDDEVRDLCDYIINETKIVDNVPARLKLGQYNTVGFVGDRGKTVGLIRNMLMSLTALHCYEDVRLVGIFDEKEMPMWESLRWLPHFWDSEKQFRAISFSRKDAHSICEVMSDIVKQRRNALSSSKTASESQVPEPYYLFIFGSYDYCSMEPIIKDLCVNDPSFGISSIFLFNDLYALPKECRLIVDMDNGPSVYVKNEANKKFIFTPDRPVSTPEFDAFARRMSAIELEGFASAEGIPSSITFLQGFGVDTVEQLDVWSRWNGSRPDESLAAPIGRLAGGKTFSLDVLDGDSSQGHFGPHGLIAGTTGSGKSELIQTWILSMAVCYHPHDVNFVIIDYKGGGMANLMEPLPHVTGKITNIGSNISRSLISLNSEVKRRLNLFDAAGVNSINKYQKLYREGKVSVPLPHLIIVSDEFAELKKEEPDFMASLVSIARVGRTLGMHLVLATQKPAGVVSEEIQANAKFRLCMKVQDVNDSREMIKCPDAAKITQAGRAYVKVGEDDYFDLFQSFYSGAPYLGSSKAFASEENRVRAVDTLGRRLKTVEDRNKKVKSDTDELTAVTRYVCAVCEEHGIRKLNGPWLPELPSELFYKDLGTDGGFDGKEWLPSQKWLSIPVGKFDSPNTQTQGLMSINFAEEGHYAIYGGPGTGKTTLLKEIVYALGMCWSPKDVNIYILDCGGWSMSVFSGMPHVGGIAFDSEEEKFAKFEKLINGEFESRKKKFLRNAVSSLAGYREAVSDDMPAIIIAIDNIVPIFDLYPDMENFFVTLSREGATYGIYMIYTANSTAGVRYKVVGNIKGAVAFELVDKGDYAGIVGKLDGLTLSKVQGRAFMKGTPPMEFQAAIPVPGATERDRTLEIRNETERMNAAWDGPRPRPIPVMPDEVDEGMMLTAYSQRTRIPVGIDTVDIAAAYMDLTDSYSMMITGSMHSGKSAYLKKLTELVIKKNPDTKAFVIDSKSRSLSGLEGKVYSYRNVTDSDGLDSVFAELVGYLNVRKKAQNQARSAAGASFDEKEFIKDYEILLIVVDDLKEFVDEVSDAVKNSLERICRLAQQLGVMVITAGRMADISRYNEIESLTRSIVGNQNGIALGATPANITFFQNDLKYSEKDTEAGEGNGYMFVNGKCRKIKLMS